MPDEKIQEWLCELVAGDGFPYRYKKLAAALRTEYRLIINHKKAWRLCKELGILRPQRKAKVCRPKRLAKKVPVKGSNHLWQMDVKYGYIAGMDRFFFQLSVIDVFDREVIAYHLGLRCTAKDAVRVLRTAASKRELSANCQLILRTDNGPQFIAHAFVIACEELGITHERIPTKTPNMNAYIEAFHAILEEECYGLNEFESFLDVYTVVSEYMQYYNQRRMHDSLKYMTPSQFHQMFRNGVAAGQAIVA